MVIKKSSPLSERSIIILTISLLIIMSTFSSNWAIGRYTGTSKSGTELPFEIEQLEPNMISQVEVTGLFNGGGRFTLTQPPASEDEAIRQFLGILQKNSNSILNNLDPRIDLKLSYSKEIKLSRGKVFIVQFIQQIPNENLPIIGTYARALMDKNVIYIESALYPKISSQINLPKKVSIGSLREKISRMLNIEGEIKPLHEQIVIRYLPREREWHRFYEVLFEEARNLIGTIDIGTEEVHILDGRIYQGQTLQDLKQTVEENDIQGSISGRGVLFDPIATGSSLAILDLSDQLVTLNKYGQATSTYTDSLGLFIFSNPITQSLINTQLSGKWSAVNSQSNPDLVYTGKAQPKRPINILFNPTGNQEFDTAQVTAYYHADYAHDWITSRLGGTLQTIDVPIPTNVNMPFTCTAWYTMWAPSLNFVKSGGGCINTAYDTVVYHEYGHFVDEMAGGILNFELSEGGGDLLACFISNQPLVAEGLYGQGTFKRSCNNNYQWPWYLTGIDVHTLGQALSGVGWDFRNIIGPQVAEQIFIPLFLTNPSSIPSAAWQTVIIDDDNSDLSDGTPNIQALATSASNHGLFPWSNSNAANIISPASGGGADIKYNTLTITGTANSNTMGIPFASYQLFYGIGKTAPTQWIPIGPPINTPVTSGTLGTWNIGNLQTGFYLLRLVVSTTNQNLQFQDIHTPIYLYKEPNVQLVTNNPYWQRNPSISNNFVVYEDFRNSNFDIYMYDLSKNQEKRITTNSADQRNPDIYGNYIVWEDYRNGKSDVYMYDISTQTEKQITSDPTSQTKPVIDGMRVVWEDQRNNNWDIYMYDISTGTEKQITSLSGIETDPDISGNLIAYHYTYSSTNDIYVHDLQTGSNLVIPSGSNKFSPSISGNIVVWEDDRNGVTNLDIYSYDISSGKEMQITNVVGMEQQPDISGNSIVWKDTRNGNDDIYIYNIKTNKEFQITGHTTSQREPRVIENQKVVSIVWEDQRNNNWDIYKVSLLQEAKPSSEISTKIIN